MTEDRVVALLRRRGRFWTAEAAFAPPPSQDGPAGVRGPVTIQLGSSLPLAPPRGSRSGRGGSPSSRRPNGRPRGRELSNGSAGSPRVREGDLVVLRLPGSGRGRPRRGPAGAWIERAIGSPEVARNAIDGLMVDRGLARGFAEEVDLQARRTRDADHSGGGRRDLRSLPTFTVDPETARDFDDAISAEWLSPGGEPAQGSDAETSTTATRPSGPRAPSSSGGGQNGEARIRVWVHIADVCAHVPEGSPLDREARARSTSVYVPGTVEPMLPQALSNEACSLVPGRDRPAVTVELDLDGAKVLRRAFYRSLIRSDMRLDYERVDRVFAGTERAPEPWGRPLEAARAAARALGDERRRRARAITLDAPEPEFALDRKGNITGFSLRVQTESHRLIEQLMIAANEAVAQLLAERSIPCLYRVHERPEPERVRYLIDQLASLSIPTPAVPDPLTGSQAAELIAEASSRVEDYLMTAARRGSRDGGGGRGSREGGGGPAPSMDGSGVGGRLALSGLLLRAIQQAHYSPVNTGHSGLGSACYCHFTSPIRRYPDIVCHRALLSTLGGPERAPAASELPELGSWTSERERGSMRIERDADDMARCFALESLLYERGFDRIFTGEVGG